jgi:2-polyprenyl-6-hydroxyphenyl methylase/3-demethylubiquinone-9 3-methyltransferase
VPEPGSILEACARLLKPGGRLFVSTINRTPAAFALAIVGAEYVAGLLAKGTHDYRSFIKPSELTRVLRAVGLEVEDVTGLHYDPLRKTATVAAGTRVNFLVAARKAE